MGCSIGNERRFSSIHKNYQREEGYVNAYAYYFSLIHYAQFVYYAFRSDNTVHRKHQIRNKNLFNKAAE